VLKKTVQVILAKRWQKL